MTNVPYTDIEIKTSHFRYGARRWGDASGIRTIGLHGWLDNAATFDHLAPLLTDLDLVSLDFPGHGYSAHRPKGMKYHYLDYVADVINVADSLRWDSFLLLGHSMGAGVASVTAASFPERVEKVILIEGIGPMARDPEKSADYLARSIQQMKTIATKLPPLFDDKQKMVDARARVGDMERSSVETLVARSIVELEKGITWRSDPRVKVSSPSYLTEDQVNAFLSAIQAETLLITAENGLFKERDYLSRRIENVKRIKHIKLEGGHHLHLDEPAAVAAAIISFLNKESGNPEQCHATKE